MQSSGKTAVAKIFAKRRGLPTETPSAQASVEEIAARQQRRAVLLEEQAMLEYSIHLTSQQQQQVVDRMLAIDKNAPSLTRATGCGQGSPILSTVL